MARAIVVTQSGTGSSPWAMVDHHLNPFNIGVGCVVTGTVTYNIQYTYDNPEFNNSPTAFTHEVLQNQTTSQAGNFDFPVYAVRVNISGGSGSVTVTFLQSGIHS